MEEKNKINKKSSTNNKRTKLVIKDKKKFTITISIFIVIIFIILLISLNHKKDISKVNDYSNLNSNKYSNELKDEYNKEENKQKFLEDYDYIQGAIGIYIMNNSTLEDDSFNKLLKNIKEELRKDEWKLFEINKPTFWNGDFDIDNEGILKFKFSNKDIEPKWIHDEELENKIILNN